MNNLSNYFLAVLICGICTTSSFAQSEQSSFLSIIVEMEKDKITGDYSAKIISEDIHPFRLKSPTKQSALEVDEEKVLSIKVKNTEGKTIKRFDFANPFLSDYEYVNEEDELTHVQLEESKKTYHIRTDYIPEMVAYEVVYQVKNTSKQLLVKTINQK